MAKKVRLPSYFKPRRYKISLHPDLERAVFSGEESISFKLEKPVNQIILHAEGLKITRASVGISGKTYEVKKISYDKKSETVALTFGRKMPTGQGKLLLSFTGILSDEMTGFYRSRYQLNDKEHFIATTQFEPTHARRAFPCVDEPAAKAIFEITLVVPKGHTAISNTTTSAILPHNKTHETHIFKPTPKMSTYLAAFVVGKFEWIEKKTSKNTLVRVFVTKGKKRQAKFALDIGVKILNFYEKYFAIKYPLPTLDMIAIPDFSAGAMENWGAIIYRETALLFDPLQSSTATKQRVALVIAHEIAHQWFGNLVTMEWWTHLWLNEGFASYIEYLALNKLFPEWEIWTQFVYSELNCAMNLDALENTHAVEIEVHHPSEIGEIFDAISYSKGASIIRMLADYLGEKDFRDGLRHYLEKHQYGNTSTKDLWLALEHISDKPVKSMMKNWTGKPGFPLVTIEVENKQKIKLAQSRFFSSPIPKKNSKDKTLWQIPVNIGSRLGSVKVLLDKRTKTIRQSNTTDEWCSFNSGASGMYRLKYPETMLRNLEKAIRNQSIPARDRFIIQDDVFALVESGELPTTRYLDLVRAYKNEEDYTVWLSIISNLNTIKALIKKGDNLTRFASYTREVMGPIAHKLGWKSKKKEKHTTPLLRALVLSVLGYSGHKKTIDKAFKLFRAMQNGKISLHPNLRNVVYGIVAKNGAEKEYRWFINRHKRESLQEEKNRLLYALVGFKNKKLINKALMYSLSKNVRPQDTYGAFAYAWANRFGREIVWTFTKSRWQEILRRHGKGGHMLPNFIQPAENFSTDQKAKEVNTFFKKHKAPGAKRTIKQVVEKIYSNAMWVSRDAKSIATWLKNNSKKYL